MYTARILPVAAPVAAGLATTRSGAAVLLGVLGLAMLLLAIRAVRLRREPADDTAGRDR